MRLLFYLGLLANIITVVAYVRLSNMNNTIGYIFFWMPILWIIVFLVCLTVIIINFKVAFKPENRFNSLMAILICTPLPSLLLYYMIISILPPDIKR